MNNPWPVTKVVNIGAIPQYTVNIEMPVLLFTEGRGVHPLILSRSVRPVSVLPRGTVLDYVSSGLEVDKGGMLTW